VVVLFPVNTAEKGYQLFGPQEINTAHLNNPGFSPIKRSLITSVVSFLPYELSYSQILRIRAWIFGGRRGYSAFHYS
jgi:hypothetical protein